MSDDSYNLRRSIHGHLDEKETEELVKIWQTNDRYSWTDMAFEEMEEILLERLPDLPPQNEPNYAEPATEEDELDPDDIADNEGEDPIFYKPDEVFNIDVWINRAAVANAALVVLTNIIQFSNFRQTIFAMLSYNVEWEQLSLVLSLVLIVIITAIECLVAYYPLKGLGALLRILMEMEYNSRGVSAE